MDRVDFRLGSGVYHQDYEPRVSRPRGLQGVGKLYSTRKTGVPRGFDLNECLRSRWGSVGRSGRSVFGKFDEIVPTVFVLLRLVAKCSAARAQARKARFCVAR